MIAIVVSGLFCLFFLIAFIAMIIFAVHSIPLIGYFPFLMCCIPLGFTLIWGARFGYALDAWRRR